MNTLISSADLYFQFLVAMLDFSGFRVLTFDCYGTLIDWESGILAAIQPILRAHKVNLPSARVLEIYGQLESEAENGFYRPYRDILDSVVAGFAVNLGFTLSPTDRGALSNSIGSWPPFPDTVEALQRLQRRFKLGVISNTDDGLFAQTARALGITFDYVVTAQQVRAYKPSPLMFDTALERIALPKHQILHVGQSRYHDIVPAQAAGLHTVLVVRRGAGATRAVTANSDLAVPDLAALADLVVPV